MIHKAWWCLGEVPYCFSRSSVKLQGHTGQKIADFDPSWAFLDCNWSFFTAIKSLRFALFLYARLKNGRIMLWQCLFVRPSVSPSVRPSVRPSFPDFFSTCFEISIWNLVYALSRWHDMLSLSFSTIGSLWPSLQPNVGQTQFLQSWPYKSR